MQHLIEPCINGDRKAQRALYQQSVPQLMGVCRRYIVQPEVAEEILSTAYVKIFSKLHTYSYDGSFEGWLKRIVIRTCLSHLRQQKDLFDLDWDGDLIAPSSTDHNADHLMSLVQQLPAGYRTVFNLYAIEGYSHSEIAAALNITEGASKSQLSKARKKLQQQLPSYGRKQI